MNKSITRKSILLTAAEKLILHYGVDKTTVEDIAREAGVSKGAIYLEWPSKVELVESLFEYEMKKLLLDLRHRVESNPQAGSFAGLYKQTLFAMQANPLVTALYTRDGRILGDFVRHQNPNRYTERILMSRESIAAMQSNGVLRADIPPEVLAHLFSLMALGMLTISSIVPTDDSPPVAQTIEAVAAMVQSGLVVQEGNPEVLKSSSLQMIDLMLLQYSEKRKNEESND